MQGFILSRATALCPGPACPPIQNAADILARDIRSHALDDGPQNAIRLLQDNTLPEEGYRIAVRPEEIRIAYRDDLGAIYGLLSVSERYLGVLPLGFWNDQPIRSRPYVSIPCGSYASPAYAVRFRGWMINDEVLLDGWKDTREEELSMWRRVFETILRCGGNMVIPGTDRKSDELSDLALSFGLWLTQHHTELLGARMFARVYPDLTPSYTKHPDLFEGLWQESIDKWAGQKVLWAVGFRGQGDKAFWLADKAYGTDEARGNLISSVICRQIEMVRAKDPEARFCANLYGEMMGLYRQGYLRVPAEVIKIWGDNGYGRMVSRRQGNDNPRVDSMPGKEEPGQNGLYYHASFYDLQAANHITMSQNPPEMIAGELTHAARNGAEAYWLINVGSIKPHLYILDLIRRVWTAGYANVPAHAVEYAKAYFGSGAVAPLLTGFSAQTVPYGPNPDDRAGDQYFHFPLRALAHRLLRGETEGCLSELLWATGDMPFARLAARRL